MTPPWMFRSRVAALLVVCVGLATMPGCGGSAPQPDKKDDKKTDPKPDPTPVPNPGPTPGPTPDVGPPKTTLREIEGPAAALAVSFPNSLIQGTASDDSLSATFVRVVGKPFLFPGDKDKGYSPNGAASWLKRTGEVVNNFTPTLDQHQVGDVVYVRGGLSYPRLGNKPGCYSLRLVKEPAGWKVDWLSVSSVASGIVKSPLTPEGIAQGFAVGAFVETVAADPTVFPTPDRAPLIAAAVTKDLREKWAEPVPSDVQEGRDYNVGKMGFNIIKIGGGTTAFTATRVGDLPEFNVELTKLTGNKTYVVKLAKGTGPNEWLVSEVRELTEAAKG